MHQNTFLGACANGNHQAVIDYIRRGTNLEEALPDGTRAIHLAVMFHKVHIVHMLIVAGADAHTRQESGLTPLHFAAVAGWCDTIHMLLDLRGININARDKSGMTPLHHAAVASHPDAMRLLVEKGASRELQECLGLSPLGCAVRNEKLSAVAVLLELGANVNSKDIQGRSLLHLAAELEYLEVAKLLVAGGANKQALNAEKKIPSEMIQNPDAWQMRYLLA